MGATAPRVVLIVEDDEATGSLIQQAINAEPGYQATLAADGALALEVIKSVQVDLFLLDIGLPGMTGIEFYDLVRAEERFRRTPALFVSASAREHAQALADRHIATFLPKPFELAALLDLVRSLAPVVASAA